MIGRLAKPLLILAGLVAAWQAVVTLTGLPHYILPSPLRVFHALIDNSALILGHGQTTVIEIVSGLALGAIVGAENALIMSYFRSARQWLLPALLAGLAFPVFAIGPILVLWFGYGMAPKILMVALVIYFPITSSFFDGLRRTDGGWLDLAHVMNATPWTTHARVRIPAAMPSLASGMRIATALAPNAAIVGEWIGSSSGLGFLMLHSNARLQIDILFASIFVLAVFSVALYLAVDAVLRRMTAWQVESLPSEAEPRTALS